MLPIQEIHKQRDRRWIRVQSKVGGTVGWEEVREIVGFRAEDIAVDLEGFLVASDEDRHNGTVDCARGDEFEHVDTSHEKKGVTNLISRLVCGEREREREKELNNFAEEEQIVRLIVSTGMRRL